MNPRYSAGSRCADRKEIFVERSAGNIARQNILGCCWSACDPDIALTYKQAYPVSDVGHLPYH